MRLRSRITVKLFIWYFALVTIFLRDHRGPVHPHFQQICISEGGGEQELQDFIGVQEDGGEPPVDGRK